MQNKKITIKVISATYPPLHDACATHSYKWVQGLKNLGYQVEVASTMNESGVNYHLKNLKSPVFYKDLLSFWGHKNAPSTRYLFVYQPYLFGRAGINLGLPLISFFFSLKSKIRYDLLVHELYHPPSNQWPTMLLFPLHLFMLFFMGLRSHHIFVSTAHFKKRLEQLFFWKKKQIFTIPVGSNIDYQEKMVEKAQLFKQLNLPLSLLEKKMILIFGANHISKYSRPIIDQIKKIQNSKNLFHCLVVGPLSIEAEEENIHALGFLEENKLRQLFHFCDLSLSFFIDGASTRRGSLLAPYSFGMPILTTQTHKTDPLLLQAPGIYWSKANLEDFIQKFLQLLEVDFDGQETSELVSQRRHYYQAYLSFESALKIYQQASLQQ